MCKPWRTCAWRGLKAKRIVKVEDRVAVKFRGINSERFSLFCGKSVPFAEFRVSLNFPYQDEVERNRISRKKCFFLSQQSFFFVPEWFGTSFQEIFFGLMIWNEIQSVFSSVRYGIPSTLSSAAGFVTKFRAFSIMRNRRNSDGLKNLRFFRVLQNKFFFSENGNPSRGS